MAKDILGSGLKSLAMRRKTPFELDAEAAGANEDMLKSLTRPMPNSAGYVAPSADEATSEPDKAETPGWRQLASSGLSGAAAGVMANVGKAIPGQEWRQGFLKGIVGTGVVAAGQAALAAKNKAATQGLTDKLYLIAAKKQTPAEAAAIAKAKSDAIQPNKMEQINAQTVSRKDIENLKGGMSDKDFAEINLKVQEAVMKDPKFRWRQPTEMEFYDMLAAKKQETYSGKKPPVKPVEHLPPLPPK